MDIRIRSRNEKIEEKCGIEMRENMRVEREGDNDTEADQTRTREENKETPWNACDV